MPAGTKSHKIFFYGITKALASRNHQVTIISPFAPSEEIQKIREIVLTTNFMDDIFENVFEANILTTITNFLNKGPKGCVNSMMEESVRNILEEDFDLVMMTFSFADCYLPYIYSKKIPFIFTFPNTIFGPCAEMMGTLDIPSVAPAMVMESHFPLTFGGRMKALLYSLGSSVLYFYNQNSRTEEELRRRGLYPKDSPSIAELQRNASLAIINSFRTLEHPQRPYNLNIIPAGGIHIDPKGNVPKDLQKWMDDSGDEGFVLFSLGSHAKTSSMKEEHIKIIIKVFKDLDLRVLWKSDEEIGDLRPKIKLASWLPQQDILAHPKIRLFITHGGLLSTQESTHFGVPVIGMPIHADQQNNVGQIVSQGWGKKMDWKDLSEEKFKKLLVDVLQDESLRSKIKERSRIMKDIQQTPAEDVIFWVEYVLRHKGAYHLQSPLRNMPWREIYNIDVWATIVLSVSTTFLIVIYTSFKVMLICWSFCFKRHQKKLKKQ